MATRSPARFTRALLAGLTACTLAGTGCVGLGANPRSSARLERGAAPPVGTWVQVDLGRPELQDFPVASMTDYERDVRLKTGDKQEDEKLTPALFWTGIALGTIGMLGMVGFGIAGFATKTELNNAYDDGLTAGDRQQLLDEGKLYNTLAIAGATMGVLGYALAVVTYGVDWNRCGPLLYKRKRSCLDRKKKKKGEDESPPPASLEAEPPRPEATSPEPLGPEPAEPAELGPGAVDGVNPEPPAPELGPATTPAAPGLAAG